jgi:hemerythrin-like domain-containing protein
MKRHPVLQDLSRDHHGALVIARRLQSAEGGDAIAARDEFLGFFSSSGEPHFRIEEDVVLPALANAGGAEDPVISRVLYDHAEIRVQALRLRSGLVSVRVQRRLGALLAGHVRLEEQELFPAIEATLSLEAMRSLASAMAEAERDF